MLFPIFHDDKESLSSKGEIRNVPVLDQNAVVAADLLSRTRNMRRQATILQSVKAEKQVYLFIYLALPARAGSPQQHMPITVGPFCLTHPVNFPCGRKPEYPEETHDSRQSVDFYSFHMGTGFESH